MLILRPGPPFVLAISAHYVSAAPHFTAFTLVCCSAPSRVSSGVLGALFILSKISFVVSFSHKYACKISVSFASAQCLFETCSLKYMQIHAEFE